MVNPERKEYQQQVLSLQNRIITLFGALAAWGVSGGIVAIIWNAISPTTFTLLGAKLNIGTVGIGFVGIGLVAIFFIVRFYFKCQHKPAILPTNRASVLRLQTEIKESNVIKAGNHFKKAAST